jgi:hypothetical protein
MVSAAASTVTSLAAAVPSRTPRLVPRSLLPRTDESAVGQRRLDDGQIVRVGDPDPLLR